MGQWASASSGGGSGSGTTTTQQGGATVTTGSNHGAWFGGAGSGSDRPSPTPTPSATPTPESKQPQISRPAEKVGGGIVFTYTDINKNIHVVEDYTKQGGERYDTVVGGFKDSYAGSGFERMGAATLVSSNVQGYQTNLPSYKSQGVPGGAFVSPPSKVGIIESHPELQKSVAEALDRGNIQMQLRDTGESISGERYIQIMEQNRQARIAQAEYETRRAQLIAEGYKERPVIHGTVWSKEVRDVPIQRDTSWMPVEINPATGKRWSEPELYPERIISDKSYAWYKNTERVTKVIDDWTKIADRGAQRITDYYQTAGRDDLALIYSGAYQAGRGLVFTGERGLVETAGMIPGGIETLAKNKEMILPLAVTGTVEMAESMYTGIKERPLQTAGEFAVWGAVLGTVGKSAKLPKGASERIGNIARDVSARTKDFTERVFTGKSEKMIVKESGVSERMINKPIITGGGVTTDSLKSGSRTPVNAIMKLAEKRGTVPSITNIKTGGLAEPSFIERGYSDATIIALLGTSTLTQPRTAAPSQESLQKAYEIAGMSYSERNISLEQARLEQVKSIQEKSQASLLEKMFGKSSQAEPTIEKNVRTLKTEKTRADYTKESLDYINSIISYKLKAKTDVSYIEGFEITKLIRAGVKIETINPIIKTARIIRPDEPIKLADIAGLYEVNFARAEIKSYRPDVGEMWARATMGEGELKISKEVTPKQKVMKIEKDIFGRYKIKDDSKPKTKTYSSELYPKELTLEETTKNVFIESDILIDKKGKLHELAITDTIEALFKEEVNIADIKKDSPITFIDKGVRKGKFGITDAQARGRKHWAKEKQYEGKTSEEIMKEYDIGKREQQKLLQIDRLTQFDEPKNIAEKEVSLYKGKPIVSAKDVVSPEDIFKIFSSQTVAFGKKIKSSRFAQDVLYDSGITEFDYDYSNVYPFSVPQQTNQILNIYEAGTEQKFKVETEQKFRIGTEQTIQIEQDRRTKELDISNIINLYGLTSKNKSDVNLRSLNLQEILTNTIQRTETQTLQEQKTKQDQVEITKLIQIEEEPKGRPPFLPIDSNDTPINKKKKRVSGIHILRKQRKYPVDINVIFPPQLQKRIKKSEKINPNEYLNAVFTGKPIKGKK